MDLKHTLLLKRCSCHAIVASEAGVSYLVGREEAAEARTFRPSKKYRSVSLKPAKLGITEKTAKPELSETRHKDRTSGKQSKPRWCRE